MVTEFWKQQRERIFPEITDFTDPQDKFRNEQDLNNLSWKHWFFMHPSAYTLMNYGGPIVGILMNASGAIYLFFKGSILWMLLLFILLVLLWDLYVKFKQKDLNKGRTYYDLHMREYDTFKENLVED